MGRENMTILTRRHTLAGITASAAALGLAAPAIASGRKITLGALRFTSHGHFRRAGAGVFQAGGYGRRGQVLPSGAAYGGGDC